MVSLVVSVEGIGKTTAHLPIIANEALNDALAHDDGIERFAGFAFRSRNQANGKAREFSRTHPVRVIKTFWEHYADACLAEGEAAIPRDVFEEARPSEFFSVFDIASPRVFARLERTREALWTAPERFDAGTTLLCITHKAAQLWPSGVLTRAWHWPISIPRGPSRITPCCATVSGSTGSSSTTARPTILSISCRSRCTNFFHANKVRRRDWRNFPRTNRLEITAACMTKFPAVECQFQLIR